MADDADVASERQQQVEALALAAATKKAREIAKGNDGFCDLCGDQCSRLMSQSYFDQRRIFNHLTDQITDGNGICSRCRDRHKLP